MRETPEEDRGMKNERLAARHAAIDSTHRVNPLGTTLDQTLTSIETARFGRSQVPKDDLNELLIPAETDLPQ
jgi:hypothetical protein